MIKGIHAMFYSSDPKATREYIRDKLAMPGKDVGEGWLIFDVAEADIGVHPTDGSPASGTHYVSFYSDDLEATMAELTQRGVEFDDAPADRGYAVCVQFTMPGDVKVELYQPRYK